MSTHHAAAGEVVNLAAWANDLPSEKSKTIVKTDGVELARLANKADEDMHKNGFCHVNGPTIFHCVEGEIDLQTTDAKIRLRAGQLAYLESDGPGAMADCGMGTEHHDDSSIFAVRTSGALLTRLVGRARSVDPGDAGVSRTRPKTPRNQHPAHRGGTRPRHDPISCITT